MYNKYINLLGSVNINPIIVPEKWRIKVIDNPLQSLIEQFKDIDGIKK